MRGALLVAVATLLAGCAQPDAPLATEPALLSAGPAGAIPADVAFHVAFAGEWSLAFGDEAPGEPLARGTGPGVVRHRYVTSGAHQAVLLDGERGIAAVTVSPAPSSATQAFHVELQATGGPLECLGRFDPALRDVTYSVHDVDPATRGAPFEASFDGRSAATLGYAVDFVLEGGARELQQNPSGRVVGQVPFDAVQVLLYACGPVAGFGADYTASYEHQ